MFIITIITYCQNSNPPLNDLVSLLWDTPLRI